MNYFLFAIRNIKHKGVRSWLTLLGIFIGILAVVSLITLGTAMKTAVSSQFGVSSTEIIGVQAGGLNYGAPGSNVVNPLTTDDVEAIDKLGSVEFAIGRNIETITFEYNDKLEVLSAYSIPENYEKEVYEITDEIEAEYGRLLKDNENRKIILGNNFYDGETNGFEKDIVPGKEVLINNEKFEVVGILKKKGSFFYDGTIFIYEEELNDLVGNGDSVDIISVKVKSKDLIDKAKEDIEKLLRQRRDVNIGEEDFEVTTPEASLQQVNEVLGGIQAFIVIIASISIIVGCIGVANTMTTSVLERRKEIGIMKAVGARNSQIFSQFLIESGFLALIGGVFGVLFGILVGFGGTFAINSWLGTSILPSIDFLLIFLVLAGSFLVGALAGISPAMNAAKQNPVEALRG